MAFSRAVQAFGLFKNGIGIHYEDSPIVTSQHQSVAKNIIVGQRFPPEIILCAGDDRVVQIHDLLPSDTKFKMLIYSGDLSDKNQSTLLESLAERLAASPLCSQQSLANGEVMQMLDTITIIQSKKGEARFTDVPVALRAHWTK